MNAGFSLHILSKKSLTDKDAFPSFYDNSFNVQFDLDKNNRLVNESFSSADITIDGKTYTIDVGKVFFNNEYQSPAIEEYGDYDLIFKTYGRMNYNSDQNKEGSISLSGFKMEAKKDIKIKNVKLMNSSKSLSLEQVDVNLVSEDETINQEWESGKDLCLPADSESLVDFTIKDSDFMKEQAYSVDLYMVIEYEVDGHIYRAETQALCESQYDSQTLYAMYKDHIDMRSLYNDYMQ